MRSRGAQAPQMRPRDTVTEDILTQEQDGLKVISALYTEVLLSCFPDNKPPRVLTTEVGVVRAVMPKVPFACRKTRKRLSEASHGGPRPPPPTP